MAHDLVLAGATVVDGTGTPGYRASVGVRAGRIAEIGDGLSGNRVLDATDLVLAPGFVDMHSHSDLALLAEPEHTAKVSQGVTLEVIGQDGMSYAPVDDDLLAVLREHLAGWNGEPPPDFAWTWRSVAGYLDRLDEGIAVNAAYLVPQGTVRMRRVGWADRPATEAELDAMRVDVATALADGAAGMSSGLTYPPGMYADTAELVELCRVVAVHGGYYSPHHRGYGAGALDHFAEMVDVARRSGVPLHLAHATMNFPVNAGRAGELLALLDDATDCDISLDTYPYLAGATYLAALLPSWAADGGPAATLARLSDVDDRARILAAIEVTGSDGCHGVPVDWATIEVSGVRHEHNAHLVGHSMAGSARRLGVPAGELYLDLLRDDHLGTSCLMHVGDEANVRAIMRHRTHTGGSDGLLAGDRPHPRAWGTFPRYLGRYVREWGVLGLAECVAHLTSRPARRLGLTDRGVVRVGAVADLVLFDPATVGDEATFERPRRQATGIHTVLVNGVAVLADGRPTGALPGHSIRGGAHGVRG
jgi:N-acyl-D-amino-acid deacylase